eukprot:scaffold5292_cov113-Isochrysis_galbana.AAC.13
MMSSPPRSTPASPLGRRISALGTSARGSFSCTLEVLKRVTELAARHLGREHVAGSGEPHPSTNHPVARRAIGPNRLVRCSATRPRCVRGPLTREEEQRVDCEHRAGDPANLTVLLVEDCERHVEQIGPVGQQILEHAARRPKLLSHTAAVGCQQSEEDVRLAVTRVERRSERLAEGRAGRRIVLVLPVKVCQRGLVLLGDDWHGRREEGLVGSRHVHLDLKGGHVRDERSFERDGAELDDDSIRWPVRKRTVSDRRAQSGEVADGARHVGG